MTEGPHHPTQPLRRDLESFEQIDIQGIEYWEARQLMSLLGFERWESAEEVIGRAAEACINSDEDVDNHFRRLTKMV